MKTLIYNTKARAIRAAKTIAIQEAEKFFKTSYTSSTEKKLRLNKNWLLNSVTAQCVCGETCGTRAIFFHRSNQFTGMAGYCNSCGSQNPMP